MNAFAIGWLQVLQNCMCMKALTLRKIIVKKRHLITRCQRMCWLLDIFTKLLLPNWNMH